MTTPDTLELRKWRELAEAACDKTDWKSSALALEMLHKSMSGPKWVALLDRLDAMDRTIAVLRESLAAESERSLKYVGEINQLLSTTLADEGRDAG